MGRFGGTPEVVAGMGGVPDVTAGAGGEAGQTEQGGAGGAPEPGCNEATCPDGVCLNDVCELETVVSANLNLSTDALSEGRACAEAIAYSVLALAGAMATLAEAPVGDCLALGDEVLLINLQGTPTSYNNVGRWELLHVSSVDGADVTFTSAIKRLYGSGVSNAGLGITAADQRVALIRVPRFGRLVIEEGVTVTAAAWNGVLGGVLPLRAAQLELAGTLNAASLGYRAGRWSEDDITCTDSIQTEAGESIAGTGTATTLRNLGASGGLGPGNASFNSNNAVLPTPGHSQPGEPGFNANGRAMGEVGAAYGSPDATTVTLGSGPGGALTCVVAPTDPTPYLIERATDQAGGIVLLLIEDLQVEPPGLITAQPPDQQRDIAFSGGYIFIRGSTLSLGTDQVTALGSTGIRPNGPLSGQTNQASPGYIVLSASSVSGTTMPPALTATAF